MEFSKSRARFRAWVLGVDGSAGTYTADTGRNVTGSFGLNTNYGVLAPDIPEKEGAFTFGTLRKGSPVAAPGASYDVAIDASLVWGAMHSGAEFAPQHVWQPVILYLGRPK